MAKKQKADSPRGKPPTAHASKNLLTLRALNKTLVEANSFPFAGLLRFAKVHGCVMAKRGALKVIGTLVRNVVKDLVGSCLTLMQTNRRSQLQQSDIVCALRIRGVCLAGQPSAQHRMALPSAARKRKAQAKVVTAEVADS